MLQKNLKMIDIGAYLRNYIEKNKLVADDIGERCGYSHSHFWQILQKEDMKCSMLEKICEALNISPMVFFDDEIVSNLVEGENTQNTNKDLCYYKKICAEKDERINALNKNIELLESLLSVYRDENGTNIRKNA